MLYHYINALIYKNIICIKNLFINKKRKLSNTITATEKYKIFLDKLIYFVILKVFKPNHTNYYY